MLLRTYIPVMPLSLFIDYLWYMEDAQPLHSKELALPDGSVDVIIELREDNIQLYDCHQRKLVFGHSILCGPHSEYFVIDTSSETKVAGIHFKPGGIHPFLKEPTSELYNKHVPLDCLWGTKADEIRDELLASSTTDEMFYVLEHRLLSLAERGLEWHPAVRFVLGHLHGCQVAELIEQTGMSHRRFNQLFKAVVGMTPKRLNRLYRFQEVLRCVHTEGIRSWIHIAHACGYYDQAHFIKDYKAFSGMNPSEYRSINGRHHNHAQLVT